MMWIPFRRRPESPDLGDQPEDSYERTMDVLGEGLEKARAAFERR